MAKQEKQTDWSKVHPWMKMAHDHAMQNQSYFVVSTETPEEFALWVRYFQRLGWAPKVFREIVNFDNPRKTWTAPCQFPEWLPDFERWRADRRHDREVRLSPNWTMGRRT